MGWWKNETRDEYWYEYDFHRTILTQYIDIATIHSQNSHTYFDSFVFSISVKILGLPCPADFFIHCPTKNPKRLTLPLWYSMSCVCDCAMTVSAIASRAAVSLVWRSESESTQASALPHSNTSFSITILELVDESSSTFTSSMTRAISFVSAFISDRLSRVVCASNMANSIVVI